MTDNKKYMISILGEQIMDDDSDKIEVLTTGNYITKKDHCYIGYKEYDESTPDDYYDNLIKVEGNVVTITRKGAVRSQLMLEKGRRHQCLYQTPAGDLMIGVFTKSIKNSLDKNGGTLEVSYTLDFNTDLVSENRFKITVEEKKHTSAEF